MIACLNRNSVEYLSLKHKASISTVLLDSYCRSYLDKYGRFPYLDELPGNNSTEILRLDLKVSSHDTVKISNVLEATGASTIEDAVVLINNDYRDVETDITPIVEDALITITPRPTNTNFLNTPVDQDSSVNSYAALTLMIDKLENLYGIKMNTVTTRELNSDLWADKISDGAATNAFIYNGEIYINTDVASVDAPIHELMHLLIGSLRFNDSNLYKQIISSVEAFPNYSELAKRYSNRTKNDVNEEIFVTEVAKFLAGVPSSVDIFPDAIKHDIYYNSRRILDTMLMGQDSVKTISDDRLFNMTLREIAKTVNSENLNSSFRGTFNQEGSDLHRKLNNKKHELLKSHQLEEYCE